MGYNTSECLTVRRREWGARWWETEGRREEQQEALKQMIAYADEHQLEAAILLRAEDDWQEHRGLTYVEDCGGLSELSEAFRGWLFEVHGEGEENGDQWLAYYYEGAETVYTAPTFNPPDFDEEPAKPHYSLAELLALDTQAIAGEVSPAHRANVFRDLIQTAIAFHQQKGWD